MAKDISEESVEKAYARWAPVYDVVFGKVFEPGRKASIAAADKIGGRILDVGVGTGISLPDYRRDIRLVGVDYSAAMLKKARRRVIEQKLDHVETLAVMDAKFLGFPEAFFDAVVAQYVVPAVPDPEATLDEFVRVTKPGGEIILANHIGAEKGPRKVVEAGFSPIARRLGWRPEFSWQRLVDWAARNNNVRLVERLPLPPMGHFSLIRYARIA
jgi:phosphatidylethanolamine/phosphatidyl-N-methylethanolamine N-methyltransferase